MSLFRVCVYVGLALGLLTPLAGQQVSTSAPSGYTLLRRSLAAQVASNSISGVTFTGTVRRIAGSDDESGTAILRATASGAARVDLILPSGSHVEINDVFATSPSGSWAGSDGASHSIVFHNLLSEPAWFFPAFAVSRALSPSKYSVAYVGEETRSSRTVRHIVLHQVLANAPGDTQLFEHLTRLDLYLDSGTLLPAALDFNVHPDNKPAIDIPFEVTYDDYRAV